MDLDYLKKLVDASIEECERTNDTGKAYDELVAYLDVETNRKPLHEAARREMFVQGFLRGNMAERGFELRDTSDKTILDVIPLASNAYEKLRRERGR